MSRERFATPAFPQTRGGLYLCGINWGGREGDEMARTVRAQKSFFSDQDVPSYRYRRRIESWFKLWGYPLATTKAEAGNFEYSISQTNWLSDRSIRSEHRSEPKFLAANLNSFLEVVRARRPHVVLLFGSCLGKAVEIAIEKLEFEFGSLVETQTKTFAEKFPFTIRYFEFERLTIVALPHPTGAVGTTDAQAKKCRPLIRRAFRKLDL